MPSTREAAVNYVLDELLHDPAWKDYPHLKGKKSKFKETNSFHTPNPNLSYLLHWLRLISISKPDAIRLIRPLADSPELSRLSFYRHQKFCSRIFNEIPRVAILLTGNLECIK